MDLLNANRRGKKVQTVALGPQDPASLPRGWPFPPTTRVFPGEEGMVKLSSEVMQSSSAPSKEGG